MKRIFDIFFALAGLLVLLPLFFVIGSIIILDSRGGVFFIQKRVGQYNKDFNLIKFRTMRLGSDKKGLITIGNNDSRITTFGLFLRKFKIDEFPQLLNVIYGDMSLVGPRPEVRKYVNLYSRKHLQVLNAKPGITDYASIEFRNENELLAKVESPNEFYINEILPKKLELNLYYIENMSIIGDIRIIISTIKNVIF